MTIPLNLTNQKFGKLLAIKDIGSQKHYNTSSRVWLCKCECGSEIQVLASQLSKGNRTSCGCKRKEKRGRNFGKWKGYKEISGELWGKIKRAAITRNLEFSISIEEAWILFERQNKKCALTDLPISFSEEWDNPSKRTASLDRIDSNKGYTIDNVQWVHKIINSMKQEHSQELFISMCKLVANKN